MRRGSGVIILCAGRMEREHLKLLNRLHCSSYMSERLHFFVRRHKAEAIPEQYLSFSSAHHTRLVRDKLAPCGIVIHRLMNEVQVIECVCVCRQSVYLFLDTCN